MHPVLAFFARAWARPNPYARQDAAPDLFFVCHRRRFLFLSIAKNACTTLKHVCFELDAGHSFAGADPDEIHRHFGYDPIAGRVIDRRDRAQLARLSGYTRFTVFRDPVERLLSAYADKAQPGAHYAFFERLGLIGSTLDPFLDAVQEMVSLEDPLLMDEHIRPQHLCFAPADVDFIVPIEQLRDFLEERFGVVPRQRFNAARTRAEATAAQRERIRALYRRDYEIIPNYSRSKNVTSDST